MNTVETALHQYSNSGAEQYYQQKETQQWRLIEVHSFIKAIHALYPQGLTGLNVCDLGCGNGFYARQCLDLGADYVAGYDLAPDMIALANQQIVDNNKECYQVANVLNMTIDSNHQSKFDLVIVSYLWNYAPDKTTLQQFIKQSGAFLKPEGSMLVITDNKTPIEDYTPLNIYGMYREPVVLPMEDDVDGCCVDYLFGTPENYHRITNYRMHMQTIIEIANDAGLEKMYWHPLSLAPELQDTSADWQAFLQLKPIALFSLQKKPSQPRLSA